MQTNLLKLIFLSFAACLLGSCQLKAQTPTPVVEIQFQLQLSDQTQAQAIFLPTLEGKMYLVYATNSGLMGIWTMTPTTSPIPVHPVPPNPVPPTPPVPPIPPVTQKLFIGIVEDPRETTLQQKTVLINKEWRELATTHHTFTGLIPLDIIEKGTNKPPASLVPFLNAAKGRELPCLIMFNQNMSLLYAGKIPVTPAEITALIRKFGGP